LPYRYLEDVAIADAAFEVSGKTVNEVFIEAAKAVSNTMVEDLEEIDQGSERRLQIRAPTIEDLLFEFLQELVYLKDAERMLFSGFKVNIELGPTEHYLDAEIRGEQIDVTKHRLSADVKAVTMHKFKLEKRGDTWTGMVILDT
jgi:SHS2 domain-containing protein